MNFRTLHLTVRICFPLMDEVAYLVVLCQEKNTFILNHHLRDLFPLRFEIPEPIMASRRILRNWAGFK